MPNIKFSALPAGTRAFNDDLLGLTGASVASLYKRKMLTIVKSTDETRNNDTTLTDDSELVFTPQINTSYFICIFMMYESGATANIKHAVSIPAGATAFRINQSWDPSNHRNGTNWTTSSTRSGGGAGVIRFVPMHGRLVMGGTAGDFAYQWAQSVSSAQDTIIVEGACMLVFEE